MIDFIFGDPGDNPGPGRMAQLITWLIMGLLILLIVQATRPLQQAAPMYDGNSWQTHIEIQDNDTNVCVGYCPDGQH